MAAEVFCRLTGPPSEAFCTRCMRLIGRCDEGNGHHACLDVPSCFQGSCPSYLICFVVGDRLWYFGI